MNHTTVFQVDLGVLGPRWGPPGALVELLSAVSGPAGKQNFSFSAVVFKTDCHLLL